MPSSTPYRVVASTTFHLTGEAETHHLGDFNDCESAREACRRLVDQYLEARARPELSAEDLFREYLVEGPEPSIVSQDEDCVFAAQEYARQRCRELAG